MLPSLQKKRGKPQQRIQDRHLENQVLANELPETGQQQEIFRQRRPVIMFGHGLIRDNWLIFSGYLLVLGRVSFMANQPRHPNVPP